MPPPKPQLVLVRHGETAWSRAGKHTGRTDVPLLPEGRQQASALAELLGDRPVGQVLTSPLRRAFETCQLTGLGGQADVDADLVEWDYGAYEGRTTAEIRAERPGWSLWADGVPEGEALADVGRRADRVLARAQSAQRPTCCFAHGHFLRVLAARWVGLPPVGGRLWALAPGSISILAWEREVPVIESWNRVP